MSDDITEVCTNPDGPWRCIGTITTDDNWETATSTCSECGFARIVEPIPHDRTYP